MSKIHRKSVTNRRPPATIELHWALPSKPQICNLSCSLQTAPCWLMQTSPRPKNVDCQCHPPGFLRPIGDTSRQQQAWRHHAKGLLNCFPQFLFWKRLLDRVSNATTKPGHHPMKGPLVLYLICFEARSWRLQTHVWLNGPMASKSARPRTTNVKRARVQTLPRLKGVQSWN